MKTIKKIIKWILFVLAIPASYLIVSLILTLITVNNTESKVDNTETIYLSTNGVHLNIILKKKDLDKSLLKGLVHSPSDNFFSLGWGDEVFYLNTPTWSDLTFRTAFNAAFLKSPSLIHLTRYTHAQSNWVEIKISRSELSKINELILQSFSTDTNGEKILLKGKGYSDNDDFYKAKGNYTCFKTCNSWVNTIFKKSGLKSCLWTPFDFGLINKYK
ncbi:DUF2459 domain-containing protein [Fulvivirgaceae bacterium BMA10]|uniref:DUF2459 domain-containing protein n=1 Tax=Splendidivirga corallicola TaxID=3051826 RepID=A0ABT8KX58_9BACT|nr:DUF2459 domain-containing protein [Fulvivirgaceae bacterium BMA10]